MSYLVVTPGTDLHSTTWAKRSSSTLKGGEEKRGDERREVEEKEEREREGKGRKGGWAGGRRVGKTVASQHRCDECPP